MNQPPVHFTYRLLSYLVSAIIAGQPLLPAVGAVITPQNGAGMDKAANGVPVVNIATPNGAGISHNRFTDYNVGKEGLILNNATGKLNPTQLGGLIQNNPNLKAGGEAKGIINEVTGGKRSLLQGYTEVAGKAANVMVANPYGITCDGCGFINTPHATLTTGRPVMNADGSLQALEVTEGSITINGAGLDGTRSDAVSIIARATEVNAALHAKDLTVTAGANRITADGRVSALKGEGDVPKVAVDTGALGGMYARRIHLTSTESGVGVNLGNLYARDGDITLDASGRLTVNNSLATGAVTAKGQGVTLTGDHKAGGNLSVSSRSDIVLSNGTLNSDKNLSLTAGGRITQQNEKLTAGRDVTLAAKNITQDTASQINAARDIVTVASDTLTTQGQITAGRNLTASATTLTQDGILLAKGHAGLDAGTLNNSGAVQGASLTLGSTTLSNSGSLLSGGPLTVNTRDFTQSGRTGAKGKVDITASGKLTSTGSLVSDDVLVLKAQDVTQNGVLSGGKGLTVSAQALSSGKKSVTHSDAAMTLNVTTVALDGENSAGDPAHANDSISPIFDKEKEQRRLQTVGLISDIGSQVADIARTQGELNALKAAQDKYGPVPADATEEQRQAYLAKLRDTPEYKKEQEKYGTGSDMQRGIQAATAALQGLAGGNMAGALAGASAPELAHLLKSTEKDPAVNAIAHAILGGAVAAMQGNNVAAGAAGAATGELAARAIAGMLYPGVKQSDLSEEQKQTISTLATVSAGLTGGLTGNSTASAAVGAQSGKNAVENNALGNKNDKLPPIIPINPLPIGVEGADGEPLNGGGGIAKGGKSKDTQIWTETKKVEPVGNAYGHWTKHGKEFPEYQNAKQYVDAAHNFMTNPPPGTLTKTRPNGDTLYYNPVTNVFASKDINGVPRTMFKPEKGIEYWNKQ
ncbi:VENN motif pre-toxin domain-containing protein [Escherichia coli]